MTETYELENIIKELYELEKMLGYEDKFLVMHRDLAQSKVHNLGFRLRVWKENNYDKLREALNAWNTAERLLNGEIREVESPIEDIIWNLRRRAKEMREASKNKKEHNHFQVNPVSNRAARCLYIRLDKIGKRLTEYHCYG